MRRIVISTSLFLFVASAPILYAATCSCVAPDGSCSTSVQCPWGAACWCLSGDRCFHYCDASPVEKPDYDGCPVVIPMGPDRQVRFTDLAGGVLFDIDADGDQDKISWTDASSTTVFLALDRNGDGVITNGGELFGNWTAQPPSAEPNGFIALAEFDAASAGGNGDGVISELDAVFANLLLWHDANQDGQSQLGELLPLPQSRISELDLRYHESKRRDKFGNLLRYQAKAVLADGNTQVVDVFFLQE